MSVSSRDITEEKNAAQRQTELLDNLPLGAALFAFDGERLQAIHINKQYMQLVNPKVSDSLEEFTPETFIHPDDRQLVLDEVKDAIADERDAMCEARLLYGDGDYRTFRLDAKITPKGGGKYLLFVAYTRITEEEQNFKTLLPYIFSTIMESSTDLAFAKDINFRYICCSQTFADLLGLKSAKAVVGKTDYELFSNEIAERFRRDDSALFADGKPRIDIHETIPSPDGTLHRIRTTKHLLRTATGNIMGVYCTGRDVTEVHEAYAQLKFLTDSIPGGIATFRCMPNAIETIYFSDGICALVGYSREEYVRRKIPALDFVLAEDRPIVHRQLELLQKGETSLDFSFRIHANNGYKWLNSVAAVASQLGNDTFIINTVLTDITARQKEKERLRLAEEAYRIAASQSGHVICRYSIADQTLLISEETASRLGLPEQLSDVPYGRVRQDKISQETADAYIAFFEKIKRGEQKCFATFRKLLPAGWRWIDARATTIFNDAGKPDSAIISFMDVTEQREQKAAYSKWQNSLAQRPEDSYTLFRYNLSKGAAFDSWSGTLLRSDIGANSRPFAEQAANYAEQHVYAEDRERYLAFMCADTMLAEYYRGHRTDALDYRERHADGTVRWLRLSVDLVEYQDSSDVEAFLMYENIDEQKRAELKIVEQAETDPLTGVLNRATFASRANRILGTSSAGARHALLLLDMDGFKQVNDVFGHSAGDQVLMDFADLLVKVSRREDLVGRLGGDEFLIFLANIPDEEVGARKAHQICEQSRKPFSADVRVSCSIGIAMYPQDGKDFEALYQAADKALYRVKATGKNSYAFSQTT